MNIKIVSCHLSIGACKRILEFSYEFCGIVHFLDVAEMFLNSDFLFTFDLISPSVEFYVP